jgi:hypothetical protein
MIGPYSDQLSFSHPNNLIHLTIYLDCLYLAKKNYCKCNACLFWVIKKMAMVEKMNSIYLIWIITALYFTLILKCFCNSGLIMGYVDRNMQSCLSKSKCERLIAMNFWVSFVITTDFIKMQINSVLPFVTPKTCILMSVGTYTKSYVVRTSFGKIITRFWALTQQNYRYRTWTSIVICWREGFELRTTDGD